MTDQPDSNVRSIGGEGAAARTDRGAQPYSYDTDATTAELVSAHGHLEPGTETGEVVSIAGRLMLRRVQGKLAFGTLADSSGRIQLFAPSRTTPDFEGVLLPSGG
ncbi:MAG: hypothetical protein M5U19_01680 [Microthrixaceae bacterium]|nr:hypothetical protein [Microthrixaceae bacterium]